MANRLLKTMVARYVPAVPAVFERPAYCQTIGSSAGSTRRRRRRSSSSSSSKSTSQSSQQAISSVEYGTGLGVTTSPAVSVEYGTGVGVLISPAVPGSKTSGSSMQTYTIVCYEAVPGVAGSPARTDYSDNFGWNGGARSRDQVAESGFFRVVLPPSAAGVMVGFCGRTLNHNYAGTTHSLVARRESFTIVESGATVYGPEALPAGATIELQRHNGKVTYWVNGTQVHQSDTPLVGETYGAVVLYSATDYVDNPRIGTLDVVQEFRTELPATRAAISDVPDLQFVDAEMPPLRVIAQLDLVPGVNKFRATLPSMVCAISDVTNYNRVQAVVSGFSCNAVLGIIEEQINAFLAVTPPLVLSCIGRQGANVEMTVPLPLAFAAADITTYNRVQTIIPVRLTTSTLEPYMPPGVVDGGDSLLGFDWGGLEAAIILVAVASLNASSEASITVVIDLATEDGLTLADSVQFSQLVELIARESIAVSSDTTLVRREALQYAVNWVTGALTTYKNFDFQGFAGGDGDLYAWKADGLYRIGAQTDAGELVSGLIRYGNSDLGDTFAKRAEAAYVGVRTDGQCYLRVVTNGVDRVYRTQGANDVMKARLAQGVLARYWDVTLELTDASFAAVDSLEIEVGVTTRRVFGRRG